MPRSRLPLPGYSPSLHADDRHGVIDYRHGVIDNRHGVIGTDSSRAQAMPQAQPQEFLLDP